MKNFRKSAAVLLAVVFIAVLAFSLVACGGNDGHQAVEADKIAFEIQGEKAVVTFVDKDGKTEVVYNDAYQAYYLSDLIFFLAGKGVFTVESTNTGYGAFFTKVGSVEQNSTDGVYVYFYTDVDEYKDITEYAVTTTFGTKTLTSASLGASSMELKDGKTYLVGQVKW
ncbi:MAG: hypothetical protein IJ735_05410 [Clostridia bacterium]|nr:hypothetical protein [Clostridia bacterium]